MLFSVDRMFPHSLGGVSNSTVSSDTTNDGANGMSTGLGAASLATVAPDPSIYNYGESDTADQVSQMASVQNQWGSVMASISTQATPSGSTRAGSGAVNVVNPVGAARANAAPANSTMLIVFGVIAVLVLYLVMEE
jgi:hypothetical protein